MKLRNLPIKEENNKLGFMLRKSQSDMLKKYTEYASEKAEMPLDISEVVASIVTTFMEDDREFQSWLKNKKQHKQGNGEN